MRTHRFEIPALRSGAIAMTIAMTIAVMCAPVLGCGRAWTPPPEWTPAIRPAPFTVVSLRVADGALPVQLAKAADVAAIMQLQPYVELTSRWCRACQWLDHGMSDPKLASAFGGTYVIRVDVDAWDGRLEGTGFDYHTGPMPAFIAVSGQGRPVGDWADPRAWQSEIPREAAPTLAAFFHS